MCLYINMKQMLSNQALHLTAMKLHSIAVGEQGSDTSGKSPGNSAAIFYTPLASCLEFPYFVNILQIVLVMRKE